MAPSTELGITVKTYCTTLQQDIIIMMLPYPTHGDINYKLHYNGGYPQTEDLTIYSSKWQTVTGKNYDYEVYL